MSTESRTFRMHDKLLLDVIKKQAGSVQKAVLEGVMNSIEAGATKVAVTVEPKQIRIGDDGRGFQSREEIELFFETFGQPHTESEGKRWAQFRMGRGQMFAFGKNEWRTGPFIMAVDINQRLGYDLKANPQPVKGCSIFIDLYEPLNDREIYSITKEVAFFVKFVSIPVIVNGRQVNTPPETRRWGPETNDDAYIQLDDGNDLSIYNLGVLVCRIPKHHFGVSGTIVTKHRVEVNFARNDIIRSCPVWKRIKANVDTSEPVTSIRRKRVLTDDERVSIIERFCAGELSSYDIRGLPLFVDVAGHGWSINAIYRAKFGAWSYGARGDVRGDNLIQSGACLVLNEQMARNFAVEPLADLFTHLWHDGYPILLNSPKYIPYAQAISHLRDTHVMMPETKLRPSERAWQRVIEAMLAAVRNNADRLSPAQAELVRNSNLNRRVCVGLSDTALAWTDGGSYIVFNRRYLASLPLQELHRPVVSSLVSVAQTLAHELCHDGDSVRQVHSPEFYRNYHEFNEVMAAAVDTTYRWLSPKRLAMLAKRCGVGTEEIALPTGTQAAELAT